MDLVDSAEVDVDATGLARASAFIEAEIEAGTFPGASLVATRHGHCFVRRFWGTYCDGQSRDVPCSESVANLLYSFSKGISATVVARAWQDGLIELDAPVSSYIPEFAGGGKDAITVRHLLTHSAGIPNVALGSAGTPKQWAQAVEAACAAEAEWPPGSRTAYHGLSGLFVAAEVVRRVSGMRPWHELCRERLLDPLGATDMGFELPPAGTALAITPQPETLPHPLDAAHLPMLGHPGGGGFGTPDAMLRLLNLHLNGGVWKGKRLLSEATCHEMRRVQHAEAIGAAVHEGRAPDHEFWGLGWLLRGTTTEHWFGFGDGLSEGAFGHAGINTVIGVADPETGLALAFLTTDSPPSDAETIRIRNTVTNLVAGSVR